jgi:hypothetical protein
MTDDQISYMVRRFLGWPFPADFSPDAGISFKPEFNEHTAHPMRHEPFGTNLLDARQAEEMVRYMVDGLAGFAAVGTTQRPTDCPRGSSCSGSIVNFLEGSTANTCGLAGCLHNYNPIHGGCGVDRVL